MGMLVNQRVLYDDKIVKKKRTFNFKYEKIYNEYKNRFCDEFCILSIDDNYCYGYINTKHNDLRIENIEMNKNERNRILINFEYKHLYKNIPLLLDHNISVILLNKDYNVIAVHHPENKYYANSFSFVYFPF